MPRDDEVARRIERRAARRREGAAARRELYATLRRLLRDSWTAFGEGREDDGHRMLQTMAVSVDAYLQKWMHGWYAFETIQPQGGTHAHEADGRED